MTKALTDAKTAAYYEAVAPVYGHNYGQADDDYPANRLRWEWVRQRLVATGAKTVLEAGCGEGTPLTRVRDLGIAAAGFDAVPAMVARAKAQLGDERAWLGDLCDPGAFVPPRTTATGDMGDVDTTVDAVLALGPFPHLTDDQQAQALRNCRMAVRPGGRVYVELRNALFALFTLNRYSAALFDHLLPAGTPPAVRAQVRGHFALAEPAPPDPANVTDYNTSTSRFNNPLTVPALFAAARLQVETIHYYHWHAFPPMYEGLDPAAFRRLSLAFEGADDWRGLVMASAFVVEAVRP